MRADYLRPWMDLLRARLEPGERILARGRAFQPHRDSFELSQLISGPGCAVVVTDRRVLWVSRSDQRWVRMLPFAAVRSMSSSPRRIGMRWSSSTTAWSDGSGCGAEASMAVKWWRSSPFGRGPVVPRGA